jgi:hypothetical protein
VYRNCRLPWEKLRYHTYLLVCSDTFQLKALSYRAELSFLIPYQPEKCN